MRNIHTKIKNRHPTEFMPSFAAVLMNNKIFQFTINRNNFVQMRNFKKSASLYEATRKLWKIRIMLEKGYSEESAGWMAERIENLIDHIQYGHAVVAYHRQDGTFRLAKATLMPYEEKFGKKYDITKVSGTLVYWDVEQQAWRNFMLENFLEWRPVC